jgi:hypothetical protein
MYQPIIEPRQGFEGRYYVPPCSPGDQPTTGWHNPEDKMNHCKFSFFNTKVVILARSTKRFFPASRHSHKKWMQYTTKTGCGHSFNRFYRIFSGTG